MIDYKTIISTTDSKVTLMQWLQALTEEFGNAKITNVIFDVSTTRLTLTMMKEDGTAFTTTQVLYSLTADEQTLINNLIKSVTASSDGVTFSKAVSFQGNESHNGSEIHNGYASFLGDENHAGSEMHKGTATFTDLRSDDLTATDGQELMSWDGTTTALKGKADRPTYNGGDLALKSDVTQTNGMQHVFIPPSTSPAGYFKDIDFGESATLYIHKGSNFTETCTDILFENCKCESVVADDMGGWVPGNSTGNTYIKNFEVKGTMRNFSWSGFGNWSALETFKVGSFTNLNYLYAIFYHCKRLKSVNADEWDTSEVTGISRMFDECVSLEKVPYFNTSKVMDASGFLYVREPYTSLPITEIPAYDLSSCTNLSNFVAGQVSLEHFYCTGMKVSFSLASSTKWEAGALVTVFNNLADVTSAETAPTLTLGATNLAKLTDAQKSIATAKGWNLA